MVQASALHQRRAGNARPESLRLAQRGRLRRSAFDPLQKSRDAVVDCRNKRENSNSVLEGGTLPSFVILVLDSAPFLKPTHHI
jgi:hypothetical protein